MFKISIITAIHNGLSFNELYWESLHKHTFHPFELIIIDNCSADGSAAFFETHGAIVIRNKENYSYPYTQNQGISVATGEYLVFLNNDIAVAPHWDKHLIETATQHGIDIISGKGIENMGNRDETKLYDRRWKRIKYPIYGIMGLRKKALQWMLQLMYGNWEQFCEKQWNKYQAEVVEGILGNNVMMSRKALAVLGNWDERLQAADFDLFMRAKKRALEVGDIKPCHIALGVFVHHYIRLTVKYSARPKPFADRDKLINLDDKWSEVERIRLHPDNASKLA